MGSFARNLLWVALIVVVGIPALVGPPMVAWWLAWRPWGDMVGVLAALLVLTVELAALMTLVERWEADRG